MQELFKKDGTQVNLLQDSDIESSTNYIKFPDGTLIQMGSYIYTVSESAVSGGNFNMMFPTAFINDTVFMFCNNIFSNARDVVYSAHPSRDGATIYFTIPTGKIYAGNSVYFKWIAIGRWK